VTGVAFSPDGSIVATGSADASARLWEEATGHPVAVLSGHVGGLTAVVFSPDGSIVATASVDGSARLWRWASGQPWVTLPGSGGAMVGVTFSPDGAAVATVTRHGHLRLWRRAGWRLAREIALGAGVPRGVAFAPDGALVATVAGTVELWDVASGAPALRLGDDAGASCVAFAPDGRHLAVGCADGAVRLWDTGVRPPRPAGALPPPTPTAADLPPGASCSAGGAPSGRGGLSVRALAFSPDGSLLAAATEEGVTRLWHVFGRRLLATLAGLPRGGWAVLLPDGRYKVAASAGRSFWWELRNVRFGVGNLDPHDTTIRPLPHDLPLPGLVRR
jgi:WD40 repeat protein